MPAHRHSGYNFAETKGKHPTWQFSQATPHEQSDYGHRRVKEPRMRFLVVDDEPLIGAALERVLSPHGVERCTSVEDAILVLARNWHFDAVISDLTLPGLSGTDLFDWMATHRPALCAQTVFMTGTPATPVARRAQGLVARPLLVKPFGRMEIREVLAEITRRNL